MLLFFNNSAQKAHTGSQRWGELESPDARLICSVQGRGHWSSSATQTAGFICLLFRSQCLIKTLLYFLFIYLTETEWMIWVSEKKEKMMSCRCYHCDHSFCLSLSLTHFFLTFIKAAEVHWHLNFCNATFIRTEFGNRFKWWCLWNRGEKSLSILKVKFIYK